MSKKKADTNKVNFEELIWNNVSNPCLTRDKSGYTWTHLNLQVIIIQT